MQKFSALFLVFLLTVNMLFAIKISPLGKSLAPMLSTRAQLTRMLIEVQQTDSPTTIKGFLENIKSLITKLQADQDSHQIISDKMYAQCEEEIAFRADEIHAANDALERSNVALAKSQAALDADLVELPELKKALDNYVAELNRATEQRTEEHDAFVKRAALFAEALEFLNGFIDYVNANLSGNFAAYSFAEKSEKLLKHASKLNVLTAAVPILVAMAQADVPNTYSYTKNEDVATKLKNALNELVNRIGADNQQNEKTEFDALTAFTDYAAKLNSAINALQVNIDRTNAHITEMRQAIDQENDVIAKASNKLGRNAGLYGSAFTMCESFALEFTDATKNRLEEIKTINEIIVIIEKRFGALPEDLKIYLDNVENGWTAYVNSTAYQKFIEYEQNHALDNNSGANLVNQENLLNN